MKTTRVRLIYACPDQIHEETVKWSVNQSHFTLLDLELLYKFKLEVFQIKVI